MLGGTINTVKKNRRFGKGIGLEVNAEKSKYTVMTQDQHAGRNHNIKIGNISSERVEQFKYLGTMCKICWP